MLYFQDLVAAGESGRDLFILKAVQEHKGSTKYKTAATAERYYAKHNETIEKYQKMLRDLCGREVPDVFSANHKLKTLFFRRFVIQQVQYVLSNGVDFKKNKTNEALGRGFDYALQVMAKKAMVDHVAFGFWNKDHLEVFSFADTPNDPGFVPLYDVDNSTLRAGIRYWKPSEAVDRFTLYEEDGFTEYKKEAEKELTQIAPKRSYIQNVSQLGNGEPQVIGGNNYKCLPIIPMYANDLRQSELEGIREDIDCYDMVKSGLANNIDDMSEIYWVLKNTGGMDEDMSLVKFLERMKIVRAAVVDADAGSDATPHTVEIPTAAREKMLAILKNDLYEDFQILNASALAAGSKTATEIRTAYQPMDDKCGDFEFLIRSFIDQLLDLLDIKDEPSFRWNRIANQTEETQMIMAAHAVLGDDLTLKKLPFLTPEEAQARIDELSAEDSDRFNDPEEPVEE